MGARRPLLTACLAAALHCVGAQAPLAQTTAQMAAETLNFFATADWGGQAAAPYTTPDQLLMAEAMGRVSASFHPHFVLSAGGNMLPGGLTGAYAVASHVRPLGQAARGRLEACAVPGRLAAAARRGVRTPSSTCYAGLHARSRLLPARASRRLRLLCRLQQQKPDCRDR